jgi:tetratricopeptide (TPR) repeat protein
MPHTAERLDPDIPILVAESNFSHLSGLKQKFEELYLKNLHVTGRGFRAIELCKRHKFGVIFIANPLVNLDGLQVIHSIREEGKNVSTPIVFLTEFKGDKLGQKALSLGANAWIDKPITRGMLRNTLEKILDTQIVTQSEERGRVDNSMKDAKKVVEFARSLRAQGDYELAQEAFREGLVEVFCGLAEIYLSKGDKDAANEILEEAERIDDKAKQKFLIREEYFIEQGRICLAKRQYLGARAEFEAALTLNENNISALFGMGEALYGLNELDKAKEIFDRIINSKAMSDDPQMFRQMGLTACRGKHFDLAHRSLDRAVKKFPADSKLLYCKAVAFVAAKEFEGAVPCLNKALRMDPSFAEARALQHKVKTFLNYDKSEKRTLETIEIT